jgi:arylsulfatase A-like enzyme
MISEVLGMSRTIPARIPTWSLVRKYLKPMGIQPVSRRMITPASRQAVTMWEVLSYYGYEVGVLGWWLLDVDLPVNGYKVENAFIPGEGAFYPDSLALPQPDPSPDLSRFTSFEYDPEFKKHYRRRENEYTLQNYMHTLVSDFKRDSFIFAAAHQLGETRPVDLQAVYFLGPDNVQHLFWKYMEPDLFPDVTVEDRGRFGGIIESYYEYLDKAIGDLEAQRGDSTVIIICSDHGMGPWIGNRSWLYRAVMGNIPLQNSGNHRREGILIMQGGPVQSGTSMENMSIHDIAPTVLHLAGLPVPLDMDGEVITQAFVDTFLNRQPVRHVPSYQHLKGRSLRETADKEDLPDYRERLKALGYIE